MKPINLNSWEFDFGPFLEIIRKQLAEGLTNSFNEYPPDVFFSIDAIRDDGSERPVKDPLEFFVCLRAFGEDGDDGPSWSFNLATIVEEALCLDFEGIEEDEDVVGKGRRLQKALLSLAESLGKRIDAIEKQQIDDANSS